MQQMEYRLEEIALEGAGSYDDQIVTRLNELAREGWRVSGISLADHPHWGTKIVPVLLERDVAVAPSRTRELAGAVPA